MSIADPCANWIFNVADTSLTRSRQVSHLTPSFANFRSGGREGRQGVGVGVRVKGKVICAVFGVCVCVRPESLRPEWPDAGDKDPQEDDARRVVRVTSVPCMYLLPSQWKSHFPSSLPPPPQILPASYTQSRDLPVSPLRAKQLFGLPPSACLVSRLTSLPLFTPHNAT